MSGSTWKRTPLANMTSASTVVTPEQYRSELVQPRLARNTWGESPLARTGRQPSDGQHDLYDTIDELQGQLAVSEDEVARMRNLLKKSGGIHSATMAMADEQLHSSEQAHREEKNALIARWQDKLGQAQDEHTAALQALRKKSRDESAGDTRSAIHDAEVNALRAARVELALRVEELESAQASRGAAAAADTDAAAEAEAQSLRVTIESLHFELEAAENLNCTLSRQVEHEREHRIRLKDRCDELDAACRGRSPERMGTPMGANFTSLAAELAGEKPLGEADAELLEEVRSLGGEVERLRATAKAEQLEYTQLDEDLRAARARMAAERAQMAKERKALATFGKENRALRNMYQELITSTVQASKYNDLKTAYRQLEANYADAIQLTEEQSKAKHALELRIKTLEVSLRTQGESDEPRTPVQPRGRRLVARQGSLTAARDDEAVLRSRRHMLNVLQSKVEEMEAAESLQEWKLKTAEALVEQQKDQLTNLAAELAEREEELRTAREAVEVAPGDASPTPGEVATGDVGNGMDSLRRVAELEAQLRAAQQGQSSYREEKNKMQSARVQSMLDRVTALELENAEIRADRDKYRRRAGMSTAASRGTGSKSTRSTTSLDSVGIGLSSSNLRPRTKRPKPDLLANPSSRSTRSKKTSSKNTGSLAALLAHSKQSTMTFQKEVIASEGAPLD